MVSRDHENGSIIFKRETLFENKGVSNRLAFFPKLGQAKVGGRRNPWEIQRNITASRETRYLIISVERQIVLITFSDNYNIIREIICASINLVIITFHDPTLLIITIIIIIIVIIYPFRNIRGTDFAL